MYYIDAHAGELTADAMIFIEVLIFIYLNLKFIGYYNSDHFEINL